MACCRSDCVWLSVIIGIIAGVILGVLFALGFVSTGIIFWAYLAIGIIGAFVSPIYAMNNSRQESGQCFCSYRRFFLTSIVGAIIASVVGFVVAAFAPTIIVAIVLGIATLFAVMLISGVVCLANCLCGN